LELDGSRNYVGNLSVTSGKERIFSRRNTRIIYLFLAGSVIRNSSVGLIFVIYFGDFTVMDHQKKRLQTVLELSAQFVQKNRDFTEALKCKRPQQELRTLHAEIQEIYNHLSILKEVHTDFSYA
jgi:hypothetical protein